MKRRIMLLVVLVGLLLWSNPAYAKNVTVQVPTFKVSWMVLLMITSMLNIRC